MKIYYITNSRPGFSYIEVLLASIIIAIMLVSGVKLSGNLGRSQQDVVSSSTADLLALNLIEEIKHQTYSDPQTSGNFGPEAGEIDSTRQFFDDVDDYHNWSAKPPQDHYGNDLSQYAEFTRAVTVKFVSPGNFDTEVVPDQGFKKVTITVSRGNKILAEHVYVIADCKGVLNNL
ncbi:MAG: hypothetical protein JXD22_14170 [Sedimentisphaerales bacterium]|nr:hypothetical protein [Sedimentisphaerales bacterium]